MTEKKTPFDNLTEIQKERLARLTSETVHDRLTVSFMIEDRKTDGKKSAFYSVTASRNPDAAGGGGWGGDDLKIVRCLLCKHVVTATYDDAVKRRMMSGAQAKEEVISIVAAYDAQIARHLNNGEG